LRITLPKEIADKFNISESDHLRFYDTIN
jgi:bifunctional DNA-binding transcriptional regulator/antitoxin component of YhaV-PrlF toxin-antitoxin module